MGNFYQPQQQQAQNPLAGILQALLSGGGAGGFAQQSPSQQQPMQQAAPPAGPGTAQHFYDSSPFAAINQRISALGANPHVSNIAGVTGIGNEMFGQAGTDDWFNAFSSMAQQARTPQELSQFQQIGRTQLAGSFGGGLSNPQAAPWVQRLSSIQIPQAGNPGQVMANQPAPEQRADGFAGSITGGPIAQIGGMMGGSIPQRRNPWEVR